MIRSRLSLQLEIVALRHQLAVYQKTTKRPQIGSGDRIFWSWLSRRWTGWRKALVFVQTGTVIAWQRKRFRDHWANLSKHGKPGRPQVPIEIRALIRKMSEANVSWGSPRIVGELHKLGIDVAKSTVDKYRVRCRKPPSPTWKTFLNNHVMDLISIDFYRFLCGTDREKQGAVRLGGPGAPPAQGCALQCHGTPYCSVDCPTDR
jgi:hypothetical protein